MTTGNASRLPPQETMSPVSSPQTTNPSEGKFIDKMSALVDKVVSLQDKQNDESITSDASGSNLAAKRQLAWSIMKADTGAEIFDGEDVTAYRRWRKSVETDVQNLDLPPGKRLELLTLRTTKYAAEIVHSVAETTIETRRKHCKLFGTILIAVLSVTLKLLITCSTDYRNSQP